MTERKYEIVFLNGLDGLCSIQDTEADIPTFYNDLGYINHIKPVCDLLNEQDNQIKELLKELRRYKVNCLWCSYCTMSSVSIHCLKREDIPYGMLDGKTDEYAATCEFYDGGVE